MLTHYAEARIYSHVWVRRNCGEIEFDDRAGNLNENAIVRS